jgi:arabinofuranosyltransferase
MQWLVAGLTLATVAAALWPRRVPFTVVVALGGAVTAGYAILFAAYLNHGEIDLVPLIMFTLGVAAAATALARLHRFGWVALALGGPAVLVLHGRVFQNYLVDDAFISFRYAQNFAAGHGIVWNVGEHVEGYTNFLWVLALTPFEKLGWNTPEASRWLGLLAAAAAWPIGFVMLREWSRGQPHEGGLRWAQVGYALLLPTCGAFTLWAFSGMETALFATLVLASAFLLLREDSREYRGPPWSALALLLIALTRFDGLLLFAPAVALRGWAVVRSRDRESVRRFGVWLAAFVVPYAAYFGWRYAYYGYPLPNTFYAKVTPEVSAVPQFERGIRYVSAFVQDYAAILLLPVAISLALHWPLRQSVYLASVIGGWTAYVTLAGGDFMFQDRLFVPIVPLVYLLAADGAVGALWSQRHRVDSRALAAGGTAALLGVMAANLVVSNSSLGGIRYSAQIDADRVTIGKWLGQNVPADYVVLVDAAGAIPYYSHLEAIDNLGINDETIAHSKTTAPGTGEAGHERSNAAYVLSRLPDLYIEWHGLTSEPWTQEIWFNTASSHPTAAGVAFLMHPETFDLYRPMSVKVDGGWFNYLKLRDSPR